MSTRLHIVVSEELLARIDGALGPGQPRADFIRRAVEQALSESQPYVFEAERQAVREAVDASVTKARVEMGSALPAEQPRDETHWRPGSSGERLLGIRSSSQSKRDVRPIPKKGER